MTGRSRPVVILGAGLSGLSLALALREAGCREPVVVVDRRRAWNRDRTWCTWLTGPLRFAELADHRWWRWRIRAGDDDHLARAARHPYIHLAADRVYESALARLDGQPGVELRTDTIVHGVAPGTAGPVVRTSAGELEASVVFDAMGAHSPLLRGRPDGAVELVQRFLGWEVEVASPVFDPLTATLMDFRPHEGPGVSFLYVLPFSPTRALLEHTSIAPAGAPRPDRGRALERELAERLGGAGWELIRSERGAIPMSSFRFPLRHGPGIHTLGSAAGAVRPSSGYAFSRIQRHVELVARAHVAGTPMPAAVAPARFELLDRIFLRALGGERRQIERLFATLAARVTGDTFARFMTDSSSLADERAVVSALPVAAMARAALRAGLSPETWRSVGAPLVSGV